jgi:hypothetical protein
MTPGKGAAVMERGVLRIIGGKVDAPEAPEEPLNVQATVFATSFPMESLTGVIFYPGYPQVFAQQPGRRALTPDAFDALVAQASASARTAERASASIAALLECTRTLTDAVAHLTNMVHRVSVPVNTLPRADLRLRQPPLFVSVEQDDEDSFIAEVAEAGVVAYGGSVAGAVERAVDALCEVYDEIAAAPVEHLGPRPLRWQAALNALVERVK